MVFHNRNGLADQFLDIFQVGDLFGITEGDGFSFGACPGRAADSVDIGLGNIGKVEVDDHGELLDIDSPGGDIGRYQDSRKATLEIPQGGLARSL